MAEKSIELDSVEIAAAVFGNCDRNIRMLEKEFSVTAVCRGTMLRISGEPANVAAAARAVEGMLLLIENHTPLEDQTVRYCLSLAHDGEEKRVRELTEDFVTVTVKGRPIRPKTLGQKEYLNSIRNNAITFGVGPAGTGKTYLAVAMAVKAFKAKDVSRIVLTRRRVREGGGKDGQRKQKALRSCGRGGQGHNHRISGRRPALCCTGRFLLCTEFLVRLHEQPVAAGRQGVPEETGEGRTG